MNLKKLVSIGLSLVIIVSILPISFVKAAGVPLIITGASSATSTAYNSTITFVPGSAMSTNYTITLYYSSSYTDTSLVNGNVALTKTGDGGFTSATTAVDITNNLIVFTLTTSAPTNTTNPFIITFSGSNFLTPATGGNYTFSVITNNNSGTQLDIGSALQYVGNTNQVLVTANVVPTITFNIRNTADNAEQATVAGLKTCALGNQSLTAIATCSYRLKVGTNSASGYSVSYLSSTNGLTNGSHNMTDAAATTGSTPAAAGVEQYGILLGAGSATGGTVTRGTAFGGAGATVTNIFNIANTGSTELLSSNGLNGPAPTDTTNTSLVTHTLTINAGTPIGAYTQTVSYTASASF